MKQFLQAHDVPNWASILIFALTYMVIVAREMAWEFRETWNDEPDRP